MVLSYKEKVTICSNGCVNWLDLGKYFTIDTCIKNHSIHPKNNQFKEKKFE